MITYNNTSKLLISQGQDNSIINLKSKASQGTSDTEFKSVFEKTLNDTTKRKNLSIVSQNDKDNAPDSKVKYKSFRDLQKDQTVSSNKNLVEKPSGAIKPQDVDLETEKSVKAAKEYDEQINMLAQMLGISPDQLVKLAKELGFTVEDLKDIKKLAVFMQKMAVMLELDDSQKEILIKLATEVSKQAKTEDGLNVSSTLESSKATENEANTGSNTKTLDLSKIAAEVKEKLNQLIQKAATNSESINSEISKVIEAMRAQVKATISANAEQTDTKSIAEASALDEMPNTQLSIEGNVINTKEASKSSNFKEEVNSKSGESSDAKAEVDVKSVNTQVSTSNDQNQQLNQQNLQPNGDIKVGIINNQTEIQKPAFSMPQTIKVSEVLGQVVEHAKVVIGQDKSEMVIHLKPDHLGKLELKVVTEQGIVAAKFIAESQQVKEIIETNMQLLKDSLQKQGISIDGISVQVGPDKQSEYQQQNSYQSKNNSSSNRQRFGGNELGMSKTGINAFDTLPERLAQYSYETNTINLTA